MDDSDSNRVKLHHEDSVLLASSLAEPINLEDSHYAQLQNEIDSDAKNLEAEYWSMAVDQNYVKALSKEAVKRQDIIYELMQTEMHCVRTLKILLYVYMHELRKSHLMEEAKLERLFPGVEDLLCFHQDFLSYLKERQSQCLEEGGQNYQITNLGDILISQFSGAQGDSAMRCYSLFCSRHSEAISFYKEQLQNNKKFQFLIKKIGQLPLVRRRGIPECFLLVAQRVTKYPVLLERLVQNTEAETEEYQSLVHGLALIKDIIFRVNAQVSEYEKVVRLSQRLEPKSHGQMKDGRLFRKEDLIQGNRLLLHEGSVTWKSSGRQKDVHAVLLSDMLLLLQEKDQKLVFAAMDNKPPVISLQGLIVREVAHEDNALFLICGCTSGNPAMYEIHTSSKEDYISWMAVIRGAVEDCREDEEYWALISRLQTFNDMLKEKDDQIKQSLTEKQQIFAALCETAAEQETPHNGLLLQQGETLLEDAIDEVEKLHNLIFLRKKDPNINGTETFAAAVSDSNANIMKNGDEKPHSSNGSAVYITHSNPDLPFQDTYYSEGLEQSADDDLFPEQNLNSTSTTSSEPEVFDSLSRLAQLLHTLQSVTIQQDSQNELQRAFQSKIQQPARHYSSVLLEQEKQRNLEKQKEELGNLHKLQAQHQDEQRRWEKEREQQSIQIRSLEAQLKQREEACKMWEEMLHEENAELEKLKEEHQQNLERLRESVKSVEREEERLAKERERLEKQKLASNLSRFQSFNTHSTENGGGGLTPVTVSTSNHMEVPPKVPPRKESIIPLPAKSDLPMHLISTTNQVNTPSPVQQRIPTKLANSSKGKGKERKRTNKSHQRTNSAASIDVNQVLPIRITGKEGGSLRSTKNTSPPSINQPDVFKPPGSSQREAGMKTSPSFSTNNRSGRGSEVPPTPIHGQGSVRTSPSFSTNNRNSSGSEVPPAPPPFPKDVLKTKQEKELFL